MKRFKKYDKQDNDELLQKTALTICTVANSSHRLVSNIRYEKKLEEIVTLLQHIPPEEIAKAKARIGV